MQLVKKLTLIFIGVAFIGLGVAISVMNNWGSDPITVFAQAISIRLTNNGYDFFNVGHTLILINLIIFVILISIYKMKYVNVGTFVGMFCVGIFTNLWMNILANVVLKDNILILKVIWMLVGVVVMSIGIGLYISSDMGAAPFDLVSVVISEKLEKNYAKVRIFCDLFFAILGWALGGVIGLTTVLCFCLIGPISGVVIKYAKKYLGS